MPADRILIDGRSGSGKTQLALTLLEEMPGAQLVHMDDLYPGWDGLQAGSEHVHHCILAAVSPRWRRWDWANGEPADWTTLDPDRPIIVEGCGALSRANRDYATFTIWVDLDAETRKRRALLRDGEMFEANWDRWAAQEEAFIAREDPRSLADLIVDGT